MVMGSKSLRRHAGGAALIASLGLAFAGCGGPSGSRLSTAAAPAPAVDLTTTSATAAPLNPTTAPAADATVRPGSTVNAVSGTDGTTPTTTLPRPPPTSATVPPPAPAGSSVYGYVTAGPTCPVERPDQPCPPRPLAAHIQAQDPAGHIVGVAESDSGGRYLLALPAGRYTVTASSGTTYPHCQPTPVTVGGGAPTRADISCDTGIR